MATESQAGEGDGGLKGVELSSMESMTLSEHDVATLDDGSDVQEHAVHGIVLAGMHAWDETALDKAVCRPLVPVAGRPLISYTLNWLRQGGMKTASICANSDTSSLRRQLKNGSTLGISLDYYEDLMPRGPAGCARDVCDYHDAGTFVALEGTILPNLDLADLLDAHRSSGAILTIVVTHGRSSHNNAHGHMEPAGIYVFSRAALDDVSDAGYQDIKESLIPKLHAKGRRVDTYFVDTRSIASVTGLVSYLGVSERAIEDFCDRDASVPAEYQRVGDAWVHSSVRLDASVRLVGPVIIERNCSLEPGVLITGPTIIGDHCHISRGAVISRSVIWSRCDVGAEAILDHCILTDRASVEQKNSLRHLVISPGHRVRGVLFDKLCGFLRSGVNRTPTRKPVVVVRTKAAHSGLTSVAGYNPVRTPVTMSRTQTVTTNEAER
jgi:NDP-sugar pyrophosphorylase family protein